MKIRLLKPADQPYVKRLITDILKNEFAIDQKAYPYSDLESISKTYGGEREAFFVADEGGKIVGTVAIKQESNKVAIIRRLFVAPLFRKKGYGLALINKAIDFCREKGYHEVIFHSSTKMKSAIGLCLKKGFSEKQRLNLGGVAIIKFALRLH